MQSAMRNPRWARWWLPPLCAALALTVPAVSIERANARHESANVAGKHADFSQQQLDQMLAPIALYPDPLLSQMLMAATYPLEVVEAARWSRANPGLQGRQAVGAVEHMRWDPSVKSLVAFPRVLAMMNERLAWTRDLGDAFLEQEPQVMDTIQELRRRALAAGNLRSGQEIRVEQRDRWIFVEPVSVEIVHVPYYDPLVVYGDWWWPAFPPVRWAAWPGYFARPSYASFYWGPAITVGTVFFFGTFDWHRRHAVIHHHHHDAFIDRTRIVDRGGRWVHDPMHRRGVNYRSPSARQRVAREQTAARIEQRLSTPRTGADIPLTRPVPRASLQVSPPVAIESSPSERALGRRADRVQSRPSMRTAPENDDARRAAIAERAARSSAGAAVPRTSALSANAAPTGSAAVNQPEIESTERRQRGREMRDRNSQQAAESTKAPHSNRVEREVRAHPGRSANAELHTERGRGMRDRSGDGPRRDARAGQDPLVSAGPPARLEQRVLPPQAAAIAREPGQTRAHSNVPSERGAARSENRASQGASAAGREHGRGSARSEKRERGKS